MTAPDYPDDDGGFSRYVDRLIEQTEDFLASERLFALGHALADTVDKVKNRIACARSAASGDTSYVKRTSAEVGEDLEQAIEGWDAFLFEAREQLAFVQAQEGEAN